VAHETGAIAKPFWHHGFEAVDYGQEYDSDTDWKY
jgi:hypothetical protein